MMYISESCGTALADNLLRIWAFLKSDEGQMTFVSAATVRALFYYLLRNPLREARELGVVLTAISLFALWIAVSESYPPKWMTHTAMACSDNRTRMADSRRSPLGVEQPERAR